MQLISFKGICAEKCLNGGKCIQKDTCQCPKGYYGLRCQLCKLMKKLILYRYKILSLSQLNASFHVSTEESVAVTTSASALMAGMAIIAKSEDFSDQFVRSRVRMETVYQMEHASARRDGAASFATHETSVGETPQSCRDEFDFII